MNGSHLEDMRPTAWGVRSVSDVTYMVTYSYKKRVAPHRYVESIRLYTALYPIVIFMMNGRDRTGSAFLNMILPRGAVGTRIA